MNLRAEAPEKPGVICQSPAPAAAPPANGGDLSTFASLDARRRRHGFSVERVQREAGINRKTWQQGQRGGAMRPGTLARISDALDRLAGAPKVTPNAILALVRCGEILIGAELARSRRLTRACAGRCKSVLPARLRRFAVYVVAVEMLIDNADLARALGCTRQNIKQARDEIHDLRDHALVDAMLDRIAAAIGSAQ